MDRGVADVEVAGRVGVRAAVLDPLPLFRRGVVACLRDVGIVVETPDDIHQWLANAAASALVLGIAGPPDWRLLDELTAGRSSVLILALLDSGEDEAFVRALAAGARAAIPRTSNVDVVQQAFLALLEGRAVIPSNVLRQLVAAQPITKSGVITGEEQGWLRELSVGRTVTRLAQSAGYSERVMYRKLNALYRKMSVRSRTEALMVARDRGWV